MDFTRLTFARTLEAVDSPSVNTRADLQFPNFSSLPAEIRIAIWESILPDPETERPALFGQRHSYTWTDSDGRLDQPDGQVPICMTTTCAALLHVNKESRYTVLRWAEGQGYKLCGRVSWRELEDWNGYDSDSDPDDDPDHEKWLPVHGPIFTRGWDPRKDILQVFSTADNYGIPSEWNDCYLDGEQLNNVQHIAFGIDDMDYLLRSRWFLQLLAATPDLKSVSFNYDCLMEADGETFHVRFLETRDVGDPWVNTGNESDCEEDVGRPPPSSPTYVRWEAAKCELRRAEKVRRTNFKKRLMEGYLDPWYWPPEKEGKDDSGDDDVSNSNDSKMDVLEKLPPWVWDREKGDFAFEVRAFEVVERRGYDDVRGGLVAKCRDLYAG